MRGTRFAIRRRGFYPLLTSSCTVLALLSACIEAPTRPKPHTPGAAGAAGRAATGGTGGIGGGVGEAGEGGVDAEAGASGAEDAGTGGVAGEAGASVVEAGAGGAPPSSGGTGGTSGGGGGGGEEIDTFNEPCPSSALDGWASVAGHEFDPTLPQPAAQEVTVTNATDLATYAASADPYIIHFSGKIALPSLDVKSNKTIIGDGTDATLEGGIRIAGTSTATADMVSNVVIRNLHINALTSETALGTEADGIGIAYAHHVWVDHVNVWDAPGDDIDVTNGSDYVTISWSTFRFVAGARQVATRVGHSDDNSAEDSGRLKVTFHHDWWQGSVFQRMPRVRFGDVHVFNSLFSHGDTAQNANTYCVAAAINSRLLVENNYFDNVLRPHVFFSFVGGNSSYTEPTAQMVARDNTYIGNSDLPEGKLSGQGEAFTPPYSVTLQPADVLLKGFMRHCTGPVVTTP